jgi:hypothetical protein
MKTEIAMGSSEGERIKIGNNFARIIVVWGNKRNWVARWECTSQGRLPPPLGWEVFQLAFLMKKRCLYLHSLWKEIDRTDNNDCLWRDL